MGLGLEVVFLSSSSPFLVEFGFSVSSGFPLPDSFPVGVGLSVSSSSLGFPVSVGSSSLAEVRVGSRVLLGCADSDDSFSGSKVLSEGFQNGHFRTTHTVLPDVKHVVDMGDSIPAVEHIGPRRRE